MVVGVFSFFKIRENFGCNCQLQSRHLSPPTAHRLSECLELASRQGRARTGPDGVRSHFHVSARHWCQFATSCWHLSVLPIKGSGMLTKPEMPGLHPGQHPAQPSALNLALSSEQKQKTPFREPWCVAYIISFDLHNSLIGCVCDHIHFSGVKPEVQRGEVTCPN